MKKLFIIIICLLVVGGLIFFFSPKNSGGGCSYADCQSTECQCFGFKKTLFYIPPMEKCYGLVYNCRTYSANGQLIK